ncbi:carboxyltransferase domain-containing protein [Labedella phragmitis]|uniref:Carboxyltransferase domain-containing protein n=1 Tax=Labedella phragmitis TaxID=2498849 RepID=A0A444PP23_9MICO|nr:5-oxoprolinase/urea amidolyase family protein [Labedella phragmitis]RWZ46164.1 carboxyltransferase domain-containing protein [Labedella phragmitis]
MRVLPVRDDAVLVELADLDETLALVASLEADPVAGVVDVVPGARTLLVAFRPSAVSAEALARDVRSRPLDALAAREATLRRIPVRYDGEDLSAVAELLGVAADEVVRRHADAEYAVAFVGFAPGFAYLTGGDPLLDVPRRSSPRTRIPAGSVALAGTYSGVYPRESPGGWQLIGTTDLPMWDLARERPAFLEPGDRVRFDLVGTERASVSVAATATDSGENAAAKAREDDDVAGFVGLEVLKAGLQTTFQDLGRTGFTSMGVSASGALDPVSLRAADRLVGNDTTEATLEVVVGGLELRAHGPQVVAVTGAAVPLTLVRRDGSRRSAPLHTAIALDDGDELQLGMATAGVRAYLAVRGGFAEEPVLGSLATDALSAVGPAPVTAGRLLGVRPTVGAPSVMVESAPARALPRAGEETVLDVVLGPRTDWLSADAVSALTGQVWDVTPQSNRVGVRLAGTPIERERTDELPSEGCVAGALQIPPNGQPVLFLADHPLTGGYPVIGAVVADQVPLAGQLPVGSRVRFRVVGPFHEIGGPAEAADGGSDPRSDTNPEHDEPEQAGTDHR